jgi:defect in organelle trafficking protein DotA
MMRKIAVSILFLLFPALLFASSGGSLTFTPPPGDYSVVFLSNLFGIVDGVLHGTGSQILGNIFGVFNSAVLALGGIIIIYTVLMTTMNTAHKGQMINEKWSSIWVPLRATLGLALLIPKASGYCLMQIFVMWVVVQGVGAADKVWEAALSYLNRGGVIIQPQMAPDVSIKSDNNGIATGASRILAGQVCMVGLQRALENARQNYLANAQIKVGPCYQPSSKEMQEFCNAPVPDFLSSVNPVAVQNTSPDKKDNYLAPMPNFADGPYAALNGMCGSILWNPISPGSLSSVGKISTISPNELNTAKLSRALAIQQMYTNLSLIAQLMVNNNSFLNPQQDSKNNPPKPPYAKQQFGIPFLKTGTACNELSLDCTNWGADPYSDTSPLFSGTEFQGAVADYNAVMLPTLTLVAQGEKAENAVKSREFIKDANQKGWLLAGSYFMKLARLNSENSVSPNLTDRDSGLNNSISFSSLTSGFKNGECTKDNFGRLCLWLQGDQKPVNHVVSIVNGGEFLKAPLNPPTFLAPGHKAITGEGSSTVYGFINNSLMVQLPGQPGLKPPEFAMKINIDLTFGQFNLPAVNFPCGGIPFLCLGQLLGEVFYNLIFRTLFNFFLNLIAPITNAIISSFLVAPLVGIGEIFKQGVAVISQPTANPVIALANMGTVYINFAQDLWILLTGVAIAAAYIPIFGFIIMPLLAMVMPLLLVWMGIMVGIGFTTAYFIPFLPYMIFTFGSIAWLVAVIEAMVAAPIVAIGVTHPEGHEAFGKGEHAIMILMNVFLRPPMMIIGYIAAIALSYVSVWIINAGYAEALTFIQGAANGVPVKYHFESAKNAAEIANSFRSTGNGYMGWAGVYSLFFGVLIYTTMYLVSVQKAFTLITYLPDKVLRWIGGHPESIGTESSQWGDELKRGVESAGGQTSKAAQQMDSQFAGYAMKLAPGGKPPDISAQSGGSSGGSGGGGGSSGGGGSNDGGDAQKAKQADEAEELEEAAALV